MTAAVLTRLSEVLSGAGFVVYEGFSSLDSLDHRPDFLAFMTVESLTKKNISVSLSDESRLTEVRYEVIVQLIGKKEDVPDIAQFDGLCERAFRASATDSGLAVLDISLGKVTVQPVLKRLCRELKLTFAGYAEEDTGNDKDFSQT